MLKKHRRNLLRGGAGSTHMVPSRGCGEYLAGAPTGFLNKGMHNRLENDMHTADRKYMYRIYLPRLLELSLWRIPLAIDIYALGHSSP